MKIVNETLMRASDLIASITTSNPEFKPEVDALCIRIEILDLYLKGDCKPDRMHFGGARPDIGYRRIGDPSILRQKQARELYDLIGPDLISEPDLKRRLRSKMMGKRSATRVFAEYRKLFVHARLLRIEVIAVV